jgi:outer membrane lipopolysaccharide assembly protein LptE/RlpB
MRNAEFGIRDLNVQHLFFSRFVKKLRTCSKLLLITGVALLVGCGYQMVGKETHVPPDLASIAIPTFVNQTLEPGAEVPFTQGFLREFINDRRVKVVDRKNADSILEGVIRSLDIYSVAYDRSGVALEYQTTVVIDLTLRKQTGEIVWKEQGLSETQWYRSALSPVISESNKVAAIQHIGSSMAGRVRNRLFYDF